jgi:1,4-dihydroxy-2-naphthoate octaprenyltransferase
VLISVNNLRDVDEDRGNGKNTLAVKWGRRAAINLVRTLTATPYVIAMLMHDLSWAMLVFLPSFVLGLFIIKRICSEVPGPQYNKYLAFAALQLILFAAAVHLVRIL